MRKARILLFLGTLVAILPYLGFSYSWKDAFSTLIGLGLIFFSYVLYRDSKTKENEESEKKTFDNFRENNDFNKIETIEEAPEENRELNQ
jgi:hypothetical protein